MSKKLVHDHYIRCKCDALYSNAFEKCQACGEPNPEMAPTLNAKMPEERPTKKEFPPPPSSDPDAPTLNAKDK